MICHFLFKKYREQEKGRRWQEIRLRQNRLRADNVTRNATLEQTMLKSGFTMSDINGDIASNYDHFRMKLNLFFNRTSIWLRLGRTT